MSSGLNLKTNHQGGIEAEEMCKAHLKANGFEILAERYKTKAGEIDIIAKNATVLLFIEVKKRKYQIYDDPISRTQKRRITNAALQYLCENPKYNQLDMRFDSIFVDKSFSINHIEDCWRIEEI